MGWLLCAAIAGFSPHLWLASKVQKKKKHDEQGRMRSRVTGVVVQTVAARGLTDQAKPSWFSAITHEHTPEAAWSHNKVFIWVKCADETASATRWYNLKPVIKEKYLKVQRNLTFEEMLWAIWLLPSSKHTSEAKLYQSSSARNNISKATSRTVSACSHVSKLPQQPTKCGSGQTAAAWQ